MKQTYCVFNQTGESFVGLNVVRSDTPLARLRRVLGQFGLKSGEGLWLAPSGAVHTLGSLAPIDLIYLDAENRVIWLVEHLPPLHVAPLRRNCSSILILPAHTIYSSQTHLGDQLLICRPDEADSYLKNRAEPVVKQPPLAERTKS